MQAATWSTQLMSHKSYKRCPRCPAPGQHTSLLSNGGLILVCECVAGGGGGWGERLIGWVGRVGSTVAISKVLLSLLLLLLLPSFLQYTGVGGGDSANTR